MSFRPLHAKLSKSLLNQIAPVKMLMQQASYLNRLQHYLNLYLSTTLQENCAVSSFQNGILTILINNAHWATRLRYQQNKLKQQLKSHYEFNDLTRITVKVSPIPLKKTLQNDNLSISPTTAKVINDTAQSISDPILKQALERLARHTH